MRQRGVFKSLPYLHLIDMIIKILLKSFIITFSYSLVIDQPDYIAISVADE